MSDEVLPMTQARDGDDDGPNDDARHDRTTSDTATVTDDDGVEPWENFYCKSASGAEICRTHRSSAPCPACELSRNSVRNERTR